MRNFILAPFHRLSSTASRKTLALTWTYCITSFYICPAWDWEENSNNMNSKYVIRDGLQETSIGNGWPSAMGVWMIRVARCEYQEDPTRSFWTTGIQPYWIACFALAFKKLVDCAMYSYRVSSLAVRFRFSMHFDDGWFTRGICKLCNSTWGDKEGDRSLKIGGRKGERRGRGAVHTKMVEKQKICFFLTLLCFILILTQVCSTRMWHGHEAWKLEPCGCPDF